MKFLSFSKRPQAAKIQITMVKVYQTRGSLISNLVCTVLPLIMKLGFIIDIGLYVDIPIHFFINSQDQASALKVNCVFQIFRSRSHSNGFGPNRQILSGFIPVIFQHSSLTYCILLVKDQSSFCEICSLAICMNIKVFNWVYRKQLNILKTCLEYGEFYIVAS